MTANTFIRATILTFAPNPVTVGVPSPAGVILRSILLPKKSSAQFQTAGGVHCQDLNCGSSSRRGSIDPLTTEAKVIAPLVASWVEKRDDLSVVRIDPSEVWTFVPVAALAGER